MIGKQIDQYLIKGYIARGGMAEVYLATDVTLQRRVALKVMLSELAKDQMATARFSREAEAVARLSHPNIIQIYTTGLTDDRRPYLAMQYVSGGTLQQKLADLSRRGQRLTVVDSLALIRQMAVAVQVAHQQDIVHRDLKPSNILMRSNGVPVLTDLGIAALAAHSTKLTQTGGVMGTPHYMSPEQALGQHVDGRSDIYSLGIMLYELLAGNVPFSADSPLAVLNQHVHMSPRPLAQVRPGLSNTTYRTVDICLAKDPADRFQTAEQLGIAIDHALRDEGLKTPQAVTSYPTMKVPQRRQIWPFMAAALFVLLLMLSTIGWFVLASGKNDLPTLTEDDQSPTPPDVSTAEPSAVSVISTIPSTVTVLHDPVCPIGQGYSAAIGEEGDVCFAGQRILDPDHEAVGCTGVPEISMSPTKEYFAVLLQCLDGTEAFFFRSDGSDKFRLTAEWDYINNQDYVWTTDGYFVYHRSSPCCSEPPPDAPPAGVVWFNPKSGQKVMNDHPSPLEQFHVYDVAFDDVLNIRSAAGVDNPIVGSIQSDGSGIEVTGLGISIDEARWVPIRYQEVIGWVNSSYIRTDGSEAPLVATAAPQTTADVTAVFFAAPPVIDGTLQEWHGMPSYLSAFLVYQDEDWDRSDDIEAVWHLGWDYSNLYLAVTVTDDVHVQTKFDVEIYKGDSVEIQFDTDLEGDYGTTINSDDFQLNVSPGDFHAVPAAHHFWRSSAGGRYQWIGQNIIALAARERQEGGYALEMAIPWAEVDINPIPDNIIGFALNVSDNDGPGTAVQEVMKSSSETRNFTYPETWGTLILKE